MGYPYFDNRKWRILKAKEGAGSFVTTDHPVCIHRPGGLNYGQQFAPGWGLSDRDVLFPLSTKVALIGRLEGKEDVVDVDKNTVDSFNATAIGYAMKQVYAASDSFSYARGAGRAAGTGATLFDDINFKIREEDRSPEPA